MSLIPVALGWSLVLLPDPACSVAFEAAPEETDVMRRPPRSPDERLFDQHTLAFGLVQGLVLLVIVVALCGGALYRGIDAAEARAITFAALVIASVRLIVRSRSRSRTLLATLGTRNPALWWISGGALCFLALVVYVLRLRTLFAFGPVHLADLAVCIAAAAVCVIGFEAVKLFRSRGG